jgi:hypothetical protein
MLLKVLAEGRTRGISVASQQQEGMCVCDTVAGILRPVVECMTPLGMSRL